MSPISPDSNVRSKSSRRRFMYDTTGVDGVNSDIVQDYETAVGNTQGNKTRTRYSLTHPLYLPTHLPTHLLTYVVNEVLIV